MSTKIGLALSGGGYRATLFSLGSLWRLNELGFLPKLNRITAVSGSSITMGHLARTWKGLEFGSDGVAADFEPVVATPLMRFCSRPLDVGAFVRGVFSLRHTVGDKVAKAYNDRLYHDTMLVDLPAGENIPEFVFYGTNYDTGVSVRMTNQLLSDYKLGSANAPPLSLAQTVGISSGFPPILAPIIIDSSKWKWERTEYASLFDDLPLRERLVLCDGGLYDNMGLEAIWKAEKGSADHFDTVLVCDAGAPLGIGFERGTSWFADLKRMMGVKRNWVSQTLRMTDIMVEQQRALRKRELISRYDDDYGGTYWGISTKIRHYELSDPLVADSVTSSRLAQIPTRLKGFGERDQALLVNWGYALTDAAMRKYVQTSATRPEGLPYGDHPL